MLNIQEIGKKMVYPGRFLILGNNEEFLFHYYGVTARSESSRAKRYIHQPETGTVIVIPTNAEVMAQGDLSLLDYTAAYLSRDRIILGNGRQTDQVHKGSKTKSAQELLQTSLAEEEYEDDKYRTPRITGCSLRNESEWTQAMHIIRSNEQGRSIRYSYELNMHAPTALFISTYAGPNIRPTPSFMNEPYEITLPSGSIEGMAQEAYGAFAPQDSPEDLRVSLTLVLTTKITGMSHVYTINAVDNLE